MPDHDINRRWFSDVELQDSESEGDGGTLSVKIPCLVEGFSKEYTQSGTSNRHMLLVHHQHTDGTEATAEEIAAAKKKQEAGKSTNPMAALVEKRTVHQSAVLGAKRKTLAAWAHGEPAAVAKRATPEGGAARAASAKSASHVSAASASSSGRKADERPPPATSRERSYSSLPSTDVELPDVSGPSGLRHYAAGWPSKEVPATETLYKMYRSMPGKTTLEVTAVIKDRFHLRRTATRIVLRAVNCGRDTTHPAAGAARWEYCIDNGGGD